ncbi:hypothetical protein TrRE_jg5836, partial [Triparma retinervis]
RPLTPSSYNDRLLELKTISSPKQTRVVLYIILSLVPVLFLVPLMIGSRDFIPPDALPPVPLT